MTTARDIIAGAYQRLGLLPLGADLDPDRTAAGLTTYNDMLNAWAADGIFPGGPYPPIQQTDGFYADGEFIDGSIEITGGPTLLTVQAIPRRHLLAPLSLTVWTTTSRSFLNSWRGRRRCSPSNSRRKAESNRSPRSKSARRRRMMRCSPIT